MQHLRVSGHFMWARGHVITISDYTLNEKQNQLHSGSYTGTLKVWQCMCITGLVDFN